MGAIRQHHYHRLKTSLRLTSSTNGADDDVPMWWWWAASAVMAAFMKSRASTYAPVRRCVHAPNFVDWEKHFQRGNSLTLGNPAESSMPYPTPLHFSSICPDLRWAIAYILNILRPNSSVIFGGSFFSDDYTPCVVACREHSVSRFGASPLFQCIERSHGQSDVEK